MAEYTYKDVIIDPQDKRLKGAIGKEVYYGDIPPLVLEDANHDYPSGTILWNIRRSDAFPFTIVSPSHQDSSYACIIIKKEPEIKYVPFDLSKKEDRDFLRGKWVKKKDTGNEHQLIHFTHIDSLWRALANTGQEFYDYFTFLDGTPVGKKVEE